MVTATGPGGVGKTRLALSVASMASQERRDGVWFVDLVHQADPAMVTAAVAQAVGVPEQRTSSLDLALVAARCWRLYHEVSLCGTISTWLIITHCG